jgi:prevent-host-death family protein
MRISEFKAKCIKVVKNINRTKKPLIITLRGTPIARVEPLKNQTGKRNLGSMSGSVKINGDIINSSFSDDWDFNK